MTFYFLLYFLNPPTFFLLFFLFIWEVLLYIYSKAFIKSNVSISNLVKFLIVSFSLLFPLLHSISALIVRAVARGELGGNWDGFLKYDCIFAFFFSLPSVVYNLRFGLKSSLIPHFLKLKLLIPLSIITFLHYILFAIFILLFN